MKRKTILKPDRQGRITLPDPLKQADLVGYHVNADGSVLMYAAEAVRAYPDMSDLPETGDIPSSLKASLRKSLASKEPGVYARSATEALKKLTRK